MRTVSFYSYVNFGDNLEHLNFLRKVVAKTPDLQVFQYSKPEVLPQLYEVVEDLPQIVLKHVDERPGDAINSWLSSDGFFHSFPGRNSEHVKFMLGWFDHLAKKAGLENPILTVEDLLFDYPALLKPVPVPEPFDVLVINSPPCSGQYRGWNPGEWMQLARDLAQKNKVITTEKVDGLPCTRDFNLSLTGIGSLSRDVKNIIGVATGPIWPTLNIWNHNRLNLRVMFVDNEYLRYDSRSHTTSDMGRARQLAQENGIL